MKDIIQFENKSKPTKKINKKRLIIAIVALVVIISIIIMVVIYNSNRPFRKWVDQYIFRKNISEENLVSIQLDYDSNVSVIPYNRYICVLAENTLKQYQSSGELANEIKLEISNPVYHSNNKYLAISEKNSSKFYLISDSKILWEKEVDGNVSKINVNQDGYVTVILTGTTHKSVIVAYNSKGNELFKFFLANDIALDAIMSPDNKYLAFAEINTTGTTIQSSVKIMSVEKAKEDPIVYKYDASQNSLITNIEYQGKDRLICMYDDSIHTIIKSQDEVIMNLQEDGKKINAADIKLNNHIYRTVEKQTGLFSADTVVEIIDTGSKNQSEYIVEGVAKNVYCYGNIIAINLGQEIEFINTNGWLIKHYTSSQDVQNIVIANSMAGIIYRDKVEIINL